MSTNGAREIRHTPEGGQDLLVHDCPRYDAPVPPRSRAHPRSASRSSRSSDGGSREEGKELTRAALLRAALKLLSRSSFDSISLREVTREAGISPTAFYRHFEDMEELGLVLVEQSFGTLSDMLRSARTDAAMWPDAIHGSVDVVVRHADAHELHMRFIARERYGGVRRIRRAIRRELQLFADELALDLAVFPVIQDWTADDRRMFAGLIAETMIHMVAELLEADSAARELLQQRTTDQLRLVSLAVPAWRSGP
jgi:AcrR family transcriptional regulator